METKRNFYINHHNIDIEFTALLRRADASGSADIIYRI